MTIVHSFVEGQPVAWPPLHDLTDAAFYVPAGAYWGRIEGWITHRWPERSAVFIVQGPGCWRPVPEPFTVATVEEWRDNAWALLDTEQVAQLASPLGFTLGGEGLFRFAGTLGDDDATVPAPVLEAARRLAEFFAAGQAEGPAPFEAEKLGDFSRHGRPSNWMARPLELSGAADLLRPWRRLR
jgi:hypothetical protein